MFWILVINSTVFNFKINSMKLCFSFLLALTLNLASAQKQKVAEFTNVNRAFYSLKYPSTWTLDTSKLMGTDLFVFAPLENDSAKFKQNINVIIIDLPSPDAMNLDDAESQLVPMLKQQITNFKLIESRTTDTLGKKVYKIIYSGKQGLSDLMFEQTYFLSGKKAFILTATNLEDKFLASKALGEEILFSFKAK